MKSRDKNNLSKSYNIYKALKAESDISYLEALTAQIDALNKVYPEWIEIDSYYILVSEILGDAFKFHNNENAKDSYLEAFELDQDNLRILAKLYECCVLLNEYEDQIKYLKLLLKLEKEGALVLNTLMP